MTDRCPYTALGGCCGHPETCDVLDCPTRQRWAEEVHDADIERINKRFCAVCGDELEVSWSDEGEESCDECLAAALAGTRQRRR